MRVTLPDGSERELEDGATGADLAASIGSGLARAALAIRVRRLQRRRAARRQRLRRGPDPRPRRSRSTTASASRSSPPRATTGTRSSSSATTPRTCWPPPCSTSIPAPRSRSARRSARASTTTSSSPTASPSPSTTSRRSRPRCASTSRPTSRSCARTSPWRTRSSASGREGQDYKVELIEDLVQRPGRGDGQPLHQRRFTDLCRGPHTPSTKRVKAFKLLSTAGAYWRGDAKPPDAHPHLRHRLPLQGGPRAVPAPARGGPRARPPPPRPRPRPVHVQRAEPRLAVLAAARQGDAQPAPEPVARGERRPRLPRGADADPLRRLAVEAVRPLGRVPRQHVLHGRRGASDGPEAHELPGARAALQGRAALVPRPADPLQRGRPRAPPRAERHPARPAARPPHHPGRRPHLLHRGAGPGGDPALPGLRLRDLRHLRLRAPARALDPAGEARRHRGDVGPRRGGAREGARRQGRSSSSSTPATARSTARRSTST